MTAIKQRGGGIKQGEGGRRISARGMSVGVWEEE